MYKQKCFHQSCPLSRVKCVNLGHTVWLLSSKLVLRGRIQWLDHRNLLHGPCALSRSNGQCCQNTCAYMPLYNMPSLYLRHYSTINSCYFREKEAFKYNTCYKSRKKDCFKKEYFFIHLATLLEELTGDCWNDVKLNPLTFCNTLLLKKCYLLYMM